MDLLVKTALDRQARLKYHLLKDPTNTAIAGAVLRYAKRMAVEKNFRWGNDQGPKDPKFFTLLEQCLVRHLATLRAKGALCPRCEGSKQPKYRPHPNPGVGSQRILACPDCDPTDGASPIPWPEPKTKKPDESIIEFKSE